MVGWHTSLTSIVADVPGTYWPFAIGRNLALVKSSLSILELGVHYILLSGKESGESVL